MLRLVFQGPSWPLSECDTCVPLNGDAGPKDPGGHVSDRLKMSFYTPARPSYENER